MASEKKQQSGGLYFGGVPTAPDVERLIEAFGVPEPGLIEHGRIEAVIHENHGTRRYDTVVKKWRERLFKEHNVATWAEPGDGVRVLTAQEWSERTRWKGRRAVREVVDGTNFGAALPAEKLNDIERHKHEHTMRFFTFLGQSALSAHRDLRKALRSPEQLPRLTAGDAK